MKITATRAGPKDFQVLLFLEVIITGGRRSSIVRPLPGPLTGMGSSTRSIVVIKVEQVSMMVKLLPSPATDRALSPSQDLVSSMQVPLAMAKFSHNSWVYISKGT